MTCRVAGELFGCSQSTVSRRWRGLHPVVRDVLAELDGQVAAAESRSGLLVDGFLVPTGNHDGVPELFSGKRHANGFNVQAVTNLDGRLIDTCDPLPGGRHDSKADRKPPGGELTDAQKAYNTSVNRIHAAAERGIAHLKNWKILKTGYRGRLSEFPHLLRTVTRLEIYRVWGRPF